MDLANYNSASLTDKCIVLDLDSTLICSDTNMANFQSLNIFSDPRMIRLRSRVYQGFIKDGILRGDARSTSYWGMKRPYLNEFLLFCFSYFRIVAVWTAGTREYGEQIVDNIFQDIQRPHVLFSQTETLFDENRRPSKPLIKMMASSPLLSQLMRMDNTLLIDDNSDNFRPNPNNGVLIPGYDPSPNIVGLQQEDQCLLQLKMWFSLPEVQKSQDVTLLDKTKIFLNSKASYENLLKGFSGYTYSQPIRLPPPVVSTVPAAGAAALVPVPVPGIKVASF